jgi:acyl-CoA synthetase (AMP-forming)/AMP-acid ligase II
MDEPRLTEEPRLMAAGGEVPVDRDHFESPVARATIGDQLRRHARTQPDREALIQIGVDGGRRAVTYGELDRLANRCAHVLAARGVHRGDRVAVMARNRIETVALYYGALKLGAAYTGLNSWYRPEEAAWQLEHAEPRVVVADAAGAAVIDAGSGAHPFGRLGVGADLPAGWPALGDALDGQSDREPDGPVDEHDLAMVIYTSGTETRPKGVMISHRNYLISTAPAWSAGLRTTPEDRWLFVMPFHTIAGIGSMTTLTMLGATLILPEDTDASRALETIRRERISVIAQTPTFYHALSTRDSFGPAAVGTVERCLTYGGQVPAAVVAAWHRAAPDVLWGTYWGQSELAQLGSVGWFHTLDDIPDGDPSWIGRPVSHLEVRVIDPDGVDADVGELWCRSPSVMRGYFKDPARTAAVMADGWVHTGDVVRTDGAGNLFFQDRRKDMIKTGGMNVSSQEVERVLHQHPDVLRAAVVGVPDEHWSEAVTAFVIPRTGVIGDGEALRAFCSEQLARYKVPKVIRFVEELPVDGQGKILKRQLRLLGAGPTGETGRPG